MSTKENLFCFDFSEEMERILVDGLIFGLRLNLQILLNKWIL